MEKHFKKRVMNAVEWPLYDHMFRNMKRQDRWFLYSILGGTNIIKGVHGCKAKVKATRMSGEMNTSIGNGWTNKIVTEYIIWTKGGQYQGYFEGDDGIFASSVPLCTQDYRDLGFDVKLIDISSCSEASFCGIISALDTTLVRDPRRIFTNFGWTRSFMSAGDDIMRELLRAKALSLAYECGKAPIIWALARKALDETRGVSPRFVRDGYHEHLHVPTDERNIDLRQPSPAARELVSFLFGITPEVQLKAESLIFEGKMDELGLLLPSNDDMYRYSLAYVAEG